MDERLRKMRGTGVSVIVGSVDADGESVLLPGRRPEVGRRPRDRDGVRAGGDEHGTRWRISPPPSGWPIVTTHPISHCATQLKGVVERTRPARDEEEPFIVDALRRASAACSTPSGIRCASRGRLRTGPRSRSRCASKKSTNNHPDRRPAPVCDDRTCEVVGPLELLSGSHAQPHRDGRWPRRAEHHVRQPGLLPRRATRRAVVPVLQQDAPQSRREPARVRRDARPADAAGVPDPVDIPAFGEAGAAVRHDVGAHRGDRVGDGHERHLPADCGGRVRGAVAGKSGRVSRGRSARDRVGGSRRLRGTAPRCAGCNGCRSASTARAISRRCCMRRSKRSRNILRSGTRACCCTTSLAGSSSRSRAAATARAASARRCGSARESSAPPREIGRCCASAASMPTSPMGARFAARRPASTTCADIPLPGLADAKSVLAIPLTVGDRLVGVLSAEDRDPMRFGEWHEAYLQIVGNQIALGIDRMAATDSDAEPARRPEGPGVRGEV